MPRIGRGPYRTSLSQQARQRRAKDIERAQQARAQADERHAYRKNMRSYERQLADLEPERYLRMVANHDLTYDKALDTLARKRLNRARPDDS